MRSAKDATLSHYASIREAMKSLDKSTVQIAMVVDDHHKLLGTITDGDIRRAILRGASIDDAASSIMSQEPVIAKIDEADEQIVARMKLKRLHQIPVVDGNNRLVGIKIIDDLVGPQVHDNWVVLMAGGLGLRLRPLTDVHPKPLLPVGKKPILETILESFIEKGFHKFFIAVNYKAAMVKKHFGNGADWGAEINYLQEDERAGTAGALSMLPKKPSQPVIVMNADILTKVDFLRMLEFHEESEACATMGVKEYDFKIPYGIVNVNDHVIVNVVEKPVQRFFVSAGIYVIGPEVLKYVPKKAYFDMPNLFEKLIGKGHKTAAFPIMEYWLDIGNLDHYEQANQEYGSVFR